MTVRRLRSEAIDDFTVIEAAHGRTAVEIAEKWEVNERTIRRRLARADIQQRVRLVRGELLALVRGQLVALMGDSCRTLAEVMASGNEKTRVAAARVVLTAGASLVPDDDLMTMFQETQEQVRSMKEIVDELTPEA
jgi:hypothetical protein